MTETDTDDGPTLNSIGAELPRGKDSQLLIDFDAYRAAQAATLRTLKRLTPDQDGDGDD